MRIQFLLGFVVCALIVGCGPDKSAEQQAERMMVTVRDLEESLDDLPKAISRYAEIKEKFANTAAAQKAQKRHAQLIQVQERLQQPLPENQDSLLAFYEDVLAQAPDYFAMLKKLGTIYMNQTTLLVPSAVKTRLVPMKDQALVVWNKQDSIWQAYDFRPVPGDRLWQDRLCSQAIGVSEMLINELFSDYETAYDVVMRGLHYGNSEDVRAKAKVVAGFCAFRKGTTEDFKKGIALSQEALSYEFLSDENRARAYHVIGLCYTYLHQDSGEMADLDAAIKALNECVNIDSGMADARDLLKTLRQMRDKLPS